MFRDIVLNFLGYIFIAVLGILYHFPGMQRYVLKNREKWINWLDERYGDK